MSLEDIDKSDFFSQKHVENQEMKNAAEGPLASESKL